jgi:hypothetical protein
MAHRSATSSTTQIVAPSRRSSRQTVQGSTLSKLPQTEQVRMASAAWPSAWASGRSSASRFFSRCRAERRAERGPSPGSLARSWIMRAISGPFMELILPPEGEGGA